MASSIDGKLELLTDKNSVLALSGLSTFNV